MEIRVKWPVQNTKDKNGNGKLKENLAEIENSNRKQDVIKLQNLVMYSKHYFKIPVI